MCCEGSLIIIIEGVEKAVSTDEFNFGSYWPGMTSTAYEI